jgi:hypothetical protein
MNIFVPCGSSGLVDVPSHDRLDGGICDDEEVAKVRRTGERLRERVGARSIVAVVAVVVWLDD